MYRKPLKRSDELKPLSREHHHGLLLSWKIRQGLSIGVSGQRMRDYATWTWENQIKPHFEFEEKYVFPILDSSNPLIIQVLGEHQKLKALFESNDTTNEALEELQSSLVDHIRFEERELFQEIEALATPEQLKYIEEQHTVLDEDKWVDEFWVKMNQ